VSVRSGPGKEKKKKRTGFVERPWGIRGNNPLPDEEGGGSRQKEKIKKKKARKIAERKSTEGSCRRKEKGTASVNK